MNKLINIKQVSALFGGIDIQKAIDAGDVNLPKPHIVDGQPLWWSHEVRRAMTAQFTHRGDSGLSDDAVVQSIREALSDKDVGFRGGLISVNAIAVVLGADNIRRPNAQALAKRIEYIGYIYSVRCNTSFSEAMRFPAAGTKTRIYHDGTVSGSPARIMELYDDAQIYGMPCKLG